MLVLLVFGVVSSAAVLGSDNKISPETESIGNEYTSASPSEVITTVTPETEESVPTTEIVTEVITETETETETEMTTETETETETQTEAITETEPVVTEPYIPQPSVEDVLVNYSGSLPEYDPSVIPQITPRPEIDPSKPMIALTFDDGPSAHTQRLLDIFDRHGGKGTFFVVGNSIYGNGVTLQRMKGAGHEIGIHTMSHPQLTLLSDAAVVDEIMMTRQMIYSATGHDTRIVRPPYGAYNSNTLSIGAKLGVCFINWSIDTLDWQTRNADAVYNAVISNAYSGAIVLCHDLHGTTVDAMERVIPKLIEDGYQLVTVSELMYYSSYTLTPGNMYVRQ